MIFETKLCYAIVDLLLYLKRIGSNRDRYLTKIRQKRLGLTGFKSRMLSY